VPAAEFPGHYLSRFLQFLKGAFLVSLDQETLREALQFANISGPCIFQTSGDEPLGQGGNYRTAIEAGKSLDEMFEQDRNFLQAVRSGGIRRTKVLQPVIRSWRRAPDSSASPMSTLVAGR